MLGLSQALAYAVLTHFHALHEVLGFRGFMAREHATPWSVSISQLSLEPGNSQDISDLVVPAPSGIGDSLWALLKVQTLP